MPSGESQQSPSNATPAGDPVELIRAPPQAPAPVAEGEQERSFQEDIEKEQALETQRLLIELQKSHLENQRLTNASFKQDIGFRARYADRFFWIALGWLAFIVGVIACQGFQVCDFELSDVVLSALLGAVTVNIASLLFIVANYMFPKPK